LALIETNRGELPLVDDIINGPAFKTALWELEPDKHGTVEVARKRRSGPFNMYWEIHGHGPIKVLVRKLFSRLPTNAQMENTNMTLN